MAEVSYRHCFCRMLSLHPLATIRIEVEAGKTMNGIENEPGTGEAAKRDLRREVMRTRTSE